MQLFKCKFCGLVSDSLQIRERKGCKCGRQNFKQIIKPSVITKIRFVINNLGFYFKENNRA